MIERDSKKKEVDAAYTRQYTLSSEAFKKLVAEKLERAEMYYNANTERRERQAVELA